MVELKTPGEIEAMAAAGRVVANALTAARRAAAPGVRLDELDQVAREVLREAGASSPFLGYQPGFAPTPFPGVVCLSVNDAVLHGPPTPTTDCTTVICSASTAGQHWTAGPAMQLSPSASPPPLRATPGFLSTPHAH